jgi:quinol monooxygenase YgiN
MIKRIVKLTFKEGKIEEFKSVFEKNWQQIKNFPGCTHVELLQDEKDPRVFFTYSLWKDQISVDNYRDSELFVRVWGMTKLLFDDKPEAWSVREINF